MIGIRTTLGHLSVALALATLAACGPTAPRQTLEVNGQTVDKACYEVETQRAARPGRAIGRCRIY